MTIIYQVHYHACKILLLAVIYHRCRKYPLKICRINLLIDLWSNVTLVADMYTSSFPSEFQWFEEQKTKNTNVANNLIVAFRE